VKDDGKALTERIGPHSNLMPIATTTLATGSMSFLFWACFFPQIRMCLSPPLTWWQYSGTVLPRAIPVVRRQQINPTDQLLPKAWPGLCAGSQIRRGDSW